MDRSTEPEFDSVGLRGPIGAAREGGGGSAIRRGRARRAHAECAGRQHVHLGVRHLWRDAVARRVGRVDGRGGRPHGRAQDARGHERRVGDGRDARHRGEVAAHAGVRQGVEAALRHAAVGVSGEQVPRDSPRRRHRFGAGDG